MNDSFSIERFIQVIQKLSSDAPVDDPKKWYRTQKEHWLGWLSEYNSAGAYGRQTTKKRDAKFAYNHIVEPKMLLWIIEAAGISMTVVNEAKRATVGLSSMPQKSAAVRRIVTWEILASALEKSMQRGMDL